MRERIKERAVSIGQFAQREWRPILKGSVRIIAQIGWVLPLGLGIGDQCIRLQSEISNQVDKVAPEVYISSNSSLEQLHLLAGQKLERDRVRAVYRQVLENQNQVRTSTNLMLIGWAGAWFAGVGCYVLFKDQQPTLYQPTTNEPESPPPPKKEPVQLTPSDDDGFNSAEYRLLPPVFGDFMKELDSSGETQTTP